MKVMPPLIESEIALTGDGPAIGAASAYSPVVTVSTPIIAVVNVASTTTTASAYSPVVSVTEAHPPPVVISLLPATLLPVVAVDPDTAAVELGMRFRSSVDTQVLGMRFYKGSAANGGVHIGSLWSATGTKLGSVTFANEMTSGWQAVLFSVPMSITANTDYVVSYLAPKGKYSVTSGGFSSAVSNEILSAPVGAGTFRYGGGFPVSSFQNSNYFVDVICRNV